MLDYEVQTTNRKTDCCFHIEARKSFPAKSAQAWRVDMACVSHVEARSWCRTLRGDEVELDDLKASANGPPIWFPPHVVPQCNWDPSPSPFPSPEPDSASSPIHGNNFSETSELGAFPGTDIDREVPTLALCMVFLGSWIALGQSSKKWRRVWLSDLSTSDDSIWIFDRPLVSAKDSTDLQHTKRTHAEMITRINLTSARFNLEIVENKIPNDSLSESVI